MRKLLALAVIVLGLTGCATIDYNTPPAADWPALQVVETDARYCKPFDIGCAWVNLREMVCYVFIGAEAVREHELAHCRGYDHPGESTMRDLWAKWKKGL